MCRETEAPRVQRERLEFKDLLDSLVLQVLEDPVAYLDKRESREIVVLLALKDQEELLVLMEFRAVKVSVVTGVSSEYPDSLDQPVETDLRDTQESQGYQGNRDHPAKTDFREFAVNLVQWVQEERMVPREIQAYRDRREQGARTDQRDQRDLLGLWVMLEMLVFQGSQEFEEREDQWDQSAQWVYQENTESQARMVSLENRDHKDPREIPDPPEIKAYLVIQDKMVPQESQDALVRRDLEEKWDQLDHRVCQDLLDHPVPLVLLVPVAREDLGVSLVQLVRLEPPVSVDPLEQMDYKVNLEKGVMMA